MSFLIVFGSFVTFAATAPVTVNTFDSEGNILAAKFKINKGPNYVGEFDAGTEVLLDVGGTYTLFAHYLNSSTERVTFVVDELGNSFNFSTTKVTFHWTGGYLNYRGSGSWKSFGDADGDGAWDSRELFPKDFYGNTMQFQFGYKWNDVRNVVVEMDFSGKSSIEKVVSQLQLLDHNGDPLAGGTARGGYASPVSWHVTGTTNEYGLLMEFRDGSNSNLSYEMKYNNSVAVVAQQESSIYSFKTQLLSIRLETCGGDPLDGGSIGYGPGTNTGTWWFPGGATGTSNPGESEAEIFPGTFSFRMQYQGTTDISEPFSFPTDGAMVTFKTTKVTINYGGVLAYGGSTGDSRHFNKPSMELLPGTVMFNFKGDGVRQALTIEGCEMNKSVFGVKLIDSNDAGLEGGLATYYKSGWKEAGTTDANGDVFVMLDELVTKLSFKMNWAGFSQQKSNVDITVVSPVVFQTINTSMKLLSSTGAELEGEGKYYASGWKNFGTTPTTSSMELLPGKYPFKIYYEGAYKQMSHTVSEATPIVEFNTVNVTMKLLASDGTTELTGLGKYYASGWKEFGTTTTSMEMLPVKFPFKMYYEGAYKQISQDVSADPIVIFNTVEVTMQLLSSTGDELEGQGKYYASGWKDFGEGNTTLKMDMLPVKYPFKIYYEGAYQQISQDVSQDPIVIFQTLPVTMILLSSTGDELEGLGKYYASGWKDFGTTPTSATMEMLPAKYAFKVYYEGASQQKSFTVEEGSTEVEFNTIAVSMMLQDGEGNELVGDGKFYASGWKDFGTTTAIKELLPVSYPFKVYYAGSSLQKTQNVDADPVVVFTGTQVTLNYAGTINYYASGWKPFTQPTMSLLPGNYPIRYEMPGHPSVQTTLTVEGDEMEKTVAYIRLLDSKDKPLKDGVATYYYGGWKTAGSTNSQGAVLAILDGKVSKLSTKMLWAGYAQQKSYVDISTQAIIFKTVVMEVELRNSSDALMDEGVVTYYASGWKDFGTTSGGVVNKELLPGSYSFQMIYEGATQQKSNVEIASVNPLVFKTVDMVVQLKNSNGTPIDQGTVKYYAAGWKDFGTTSGGVVNKELLPVSYSFQMIYEGATQQKSNVDISSVNPLVYETVNVTMRLLDTDGVTELAGMGKYYASGWKIFGTTTANKELLEGSYSFQAHYNGDYQQKSNVVVSGPTELIFNVADLKGAKMSGGVELNKVYPNPFIYATNIDFSLEAAQQVRISVYDMKGALVRTLLNKTMSEGAHSIIWDSQNGREINQGTYIIELRSNEFMKQIKVIKTR